MTMKEYKFRVWDTVDCKYTQSLEFPPKSDLIGIYSIQHYPNRYIYQQYISLKDKNNQEIHENDIVFCTITNKFDYKTTVCGVIIYDSSDCSYKLVTYSDYKNNEIDKIYPINYNNIYQVIGNTYENKEILENNQMC